ncbi:DUF3042 family protein [Secundilactobacillus oryzae]
MKNFTKGFLFGAVATIGAVAGALVSFKKSRCRTNRARGTTL